MFWGWRVANYLVFKKVREALGFQQCKIFAFGAAPMREEIYDYFMSINIRLTEVFEMNECSGPTTLNFIPQDGERVSVVNLSRESR